MDMVMNNSQSSSIAAAVSPIDTDNSITPTQVATHNAPTHTILASTPKQTLQTNITPNKQLTDYNLSDDNGTKVSSEEVAVQEVVVPTLSKTTKVNVGNNAPVSRQDMSGRSKTMPMCKTSQEMSDNRISAVSKTMTKKSPKEDNGLTCEKKVCQNKFNPCLDIKNSSAKDGTRKKSRPKSSKRGIAKFTSDYWQHGLQKFELAAVPTTRKLPKGVRATTAGNYQVAVWYQGRNRAISTFQNLEQATLASEVVHNMLEKDKGLQLSAKECERNIKLAKEAAWNVNKDGKQSGNVTRKKRRSQSRSSSAIFPSSTINYLNECSRLNPYPDADQTARICIVTGLNNIQVEEWMSSARKKRLSVEAKTHINKWIEEHSINPYPTREVKDAWIKLYGIENDSQLDGYLHRARKNIKENSTMKNDVSTLKTCGLCNIQKKEWSYTIGEWNKLDDRDRLCKYCISKVRTASLSKDDGLMAVTRTRTGPVVKSRERLVAIPQDTSLKRGKGQTVKRDRKRPRKKKELSQKEKDYCSSSSGRGRPKKSKKSIQAEAYLAKGYQLCSVAGCIKRVQQGGVCCRHGAKTTRALCSYKGTDEGFNGFSMGVGAGGQCPNVAKRGGLCRRHGAFDLPDCNDPFCKRVAQKGDDYCVLHTKSICLPQKEGNRKRTVVYDGTESQKKKPKLKPFEPSKVVASKSKRAAPSRRQSSAEGVYELPSGSWRVMVYYQGSHRGVGTFQTLEQATLASEVARSMIKKDKGLQLSAKECERNFKLAKEAASASCVKRGRGRPREGPNSLPQGVYETTSGSYQVQLYYQGKNRNIGTFQTLDSATLAKEIARSMLKKDKGLQLSSEECERNIKLAKEAALADVPNNEMCSKSTKRGRKQRKIASVRGTTTSSGSTSRTTSRKDMINEIQGVRRLTGCKNRWGAVLKVSGNDIFLGSYKTQAEAAYAVEMAKEESKMRSSMTSGECSPFIRSKSSLDLQDMPSDKIGESLMDTETTKDEDLSARISKYLSPEYQSEKQAEEQHKDQDKEEPADNFIADVMNIPTIETVISKFEEARKAGHQPKTFNLQSYMAEHDKKYSYLIDVKNDSTNSSNKRRKKSTPKRLKGGL